MSHNSLHVPGGRELWLIITLCLYGIERQVGYIDCSSQGFMVHKLPKSEGEA